MFTVCPITIKNQHEKTRRPAVESQFVAASVVRLCAAVNVVEKSLVLGSFDRLVFSPIYIYLKVAKVSSV